MGSKMFVRDAAETDIDAIVDLIEANRLRLQEWEPRFWKKSQSSAEMSRAFLATLLTDADVIFLVAAEQSQIFGCLHCKPSFVPPVYDPGGTTWMVDDFCVHDQSWDEAGQLLLDELKLRTLAKAEGQLILPSPHRDSRANEFILGAGLRPTTTWFTLGS